MARSATSPRAGTHWNARNRTTRRTQHHSRRCLPDLRAADPSRGLTLSVINAYWSVSTCGGETTEAQDTRLLDPAGQCGRSRRQAMSQQSSRQRDPSRCHAAGHDGAENPNGFATTIRKATKRNLLASNDSLASRAAKASGRDPDRNNAQQARWARLRSQERSLYPTPVTGGSRPRLAPLYKRPTSSYGVVTMSETESKTYHGSCHCGAVAYEVTMTPPSQAIACNCFMCSRAGWLLAFVGGDAFRLLSGEDALSKYQFNRKHIDHLFCKHCGIKSFSRGTNRDGSPSVAINLRCLKGFDATKLPVHAFDGASL